MSKKLQLRGGTTSQHNSFTGAIREVTVDTNKDTLVVHDGSTQGGFALPRTGAEISALVTIANDAVTEAKLNLISTSSVPSLEAKGTSGSTSGYIKLNCSENSHGIKLLGPPHSAGANYTLTFPNNDGNANQVLTTNGSGVMTWAAIGSNSITDGDVTTAKLANDSVTTDKIAHNVALVGNPTTTTQAESDNTTKLATTAYVTSKITTLIGGAPSTLNDLNELAEAINDDANYNSTLTTALGTKLPKAGGTMTGNLKFNDNVQAKFGTGDDLKISHDGSNSLIADEGTGNLELNSSGAGIIMKNGSTEIMGKFLSDGAVELYHNAAKKIETTSGGVYVTGNVYVGDNGKFVSGGADDLQIYHDGSHSFITDTGTGNLNIKGSAAVKIQSAAGEDMFTANTDGSVDLYHNNAKKFETTAAGATVSGVLTATLQANAIDSDHYVDGSIDTVHLGNLQVTGSKLALDHRSDASTNDVKVGNQHDYIYADASDGLRFYTAGAEDMRLTDAGVLHVDNDVIAFSSTISDERLKHDIEPITDALSKVGQLNGCTFTYNKEDKKSAGLIAQDVEKVLPSAVSEMELPLQHDDGIAYKTVQYDQTIGLLVEAIKELTAKVEQLENK